MLEILNRERDTDRSLVLGVTGGTLRLDPIALYDSTENEFIASAFRAETSVKSKVSWLRSQPSSQFPQTHRTGDFQPSFQSSQYSAQFSPDGQRVVTVSEDKKARLWDVPTISSKDSAEDVLRQFGRVAREPPGTRHRASGTQSTGL